MGSTDASVPFESSDLLQGESLGEILAATERSQSGQDKGKPTVKAQTFPDWESAIDHAWKLVKGHKISMTEFRKIVDKADVENAA